MKPIEEPIVEIVKPKVEKVPTEIPTPILETLTQEGEAAMQKGVSKRFKKLHFTQTRFVIREI